MAKEVSDFWLVWCPQGGAPTVKHDTLYSAQAEALRLSSLNPGKDFFVMSAVDGYCLPKPGPEQITIGFDRPF